MTAGSSNLVKADEDFNNSAIPILDALALNYSFIMTVFTDVKNDKKAEVSIGVENKCDDLRNFFVVAASYGTEGAKAHISIINLKRMDYAKNMAAVET